MRSGNPFNIQNKNLSYTKVFLKREMSRKPTPNFISPITFLCQTVFVLFLTCYKIFISIFFSLCSSWQLKTFIYLLCWTVESIIDTKLLLFVFSQLLTDLLCWWGVISRASSSIKKVFNPFDAREMIVWMKRRNKIWRL